MFGYLDRMLRRRDITLRFHEIRSDDASDKSVEQVARILGAGKRPKGLLTTPDSLNERDVNLIKDAVNGRQLVDGQVVKIAR